MMRLHPGWTSRGCYAAMLMTTKAMLWGMLSRVSLWMMTRRVLTVQSLLALDEC